MAFKESDYSTMCRSCLSTDRQMIDLYSQSTDGFNLTYMDCFNLCLKFRRGDENNEHLMPKTICNSCLNELRVSFSFRSKCQKSDYELRTHFKKLVKYETLETTQDGQIKLIMDSNIDAVETEEIEIEYEVAEDRKLFAEQHENVSNVSVLI